VRKTHCHDDKSICSAKDVVRFQVLTATSMKIAVVWGVAPCSLVDTGRLMETVSSSKTSADIFEITRYKIQEDSHLQRSDIFRLMCCRKRSKTLN
jgi:hypothetical protein